jgi:hypothetical protein
VRRSVPAGIVSLILVLLTGTARAQVADGPQVSAYGELIGNLSSASLNVDAFYSNGLIVRGGFLPVLRSKEGSEHWTDRIESVVVVLTAGYAHGSGPGRIETGLGVLLGENESEWLDGQRIRVPALTATIGYRVDPPDSGSVFRIGFTPIVSGGRLIPRIGVSIGFTLSEDD